MALTKRVMRTKQALILITSVFFIMGTVWFGSHPDSHPVLPHNNYIHYEPVNVPKKPFDDTGDILRELGLLVDFSNRTVTQIIKAKPNSNPAIDEVGFEIPAPWLLELPPYADVTKYALVTAYFSKDDTEGLLKLIYSVSQNAKDNHLLIFDLFSSGTGKAQRDLKRVSAYCNMTQVCSMQKLSPSVLSGHLLPRHVLNSNGRMGAHKPLFMMKALMKFPGVLWVDVNMYISSGLDGVWKATDSNNVTVWRRKDRCPASSYTFSELFTYFGKTVIPFRFISMIQSDSYAIKRTWFTEELMTLWLNCSFTLKCISPLGADNSKCDLNCGAVQPKFDYFGCHKYEASALIASLTYLLHQPDSVIIEPDTSHLNINLNPFCRDLSYNRTAVLQNISSFINPTQTNYNDKPIDLHKISN